MLLLLGGCEMVLGIQWLATLGDMQCNFKKLIMKFNHKGRQIVLRGMSKTHVHWMQGNEGMLKQAELSSMAFCVYPVQLCQMESIGSVSAEVEQVLTQFDEVFEIPKDLPPQKSHDHQIPLMPNTPPINVRPYRHPPNQKDAIEGMVKKLMDSGVIRLNKHTVKDKFPIHVIEELIDELHGSVVTHEGHYEFLVMPFGLTNAPSTFQSLMNTVFKAFLRKFVLVFFDDILIYSKKLEEHCDHLAQVLQVMKDNTLYAKKSKCYFAVPQVEYLGHIISAQGVSTNPSKIEAIQKWPIPSTLKQLRGFLGLTGYYRRFIKDYASISQPLVALTKKDAFKTKHFSLKYLLNQKLTTPFQFKWLPKLLGYDNEIVYKKGSENVVADALSRMGSSGELLQISVSSVSSSVWDKVKDTIGGHSGAHVNMKKLGSLFYWKGLKKMVKQMVSMDFIEKLPTSHGKSVILVVVDRLSKYAHFIPLAHPFTASQVAQVFLDQVYKLHGLPESIVKLKLSTAYHPQTDGQTEVVNRSLGCYLRCMCGEKPKEWVKWLSLAEFWYNTNYHTSTKTTPYEAVYCQTPPIHVPYIPGDSRVEEVDRTLQAREEAIKVLKFHLKRSQDRMRNQANKHRTDRQFEVDDWVYLKLQPHRQVSIRQGQQHKLSPKYYGPFKVAERIGEVAYKLELPSSSQIHPVFHISQLKKCHGKDHSMGVLPQLREDGLLENKPMAILERRLGKVNNKPVMFVLIQWTNKPVEEATWEIYGDLITRFPGFDAVNEAIP
ncbi:retrotransposable element Tf2 [Tanacetum coccineum]